MILSQKDSVVRVEAMMLDKEAAHVASIVYTSFEQITGFLVVDPHLQD
jgi:hypothetical protein